MNIKEQVEDVVLRKEKIEEINSLICELYDKCLEIIQVIGEKDPQADPAYSEILLKEAQEMDKKIFSKMRKVFPNAKVWSLLYEMFSVYWPEEFWMFRLIKMMKNGSLRSQEGIFIETLDFLEKSLKEIRVPGEDNS